MPVLYLALAFHAAFLAPLFDYWTQPVGARAAGEPDRRRQRRQRAGAGRAHRPGPPRRRCGGVGPRRRRGRHRGGLPARRGLARTPARGSSPSRPSIAWRVRIPSRSPAPTAATVGYASRSRPWVTTPRGLGVACTAGSAMQIEGPYGCFDLPQSLDGREQIWIAGGIGVTPFLAWLEALQARPEQAPDVDFYYSVRRAPRPPPSSPVSRPCARTCPRCACT